MKIGGQYGDVTNPLIFFYPDVPWEEIEHSLENTLLSKSRKVRYYEVPISFDIETTSFISSQLEKLATMYAWALAIDCYVILGRTWNDFDDVYWKLIEMFCPTESQRIIIWVHNLSYEFQFICNRFKWSKVFALHERKPIYAVTEEFVEFRCSYLLSGLSLAKVGENLQRYKVKKLVGDLDYSLMRHYLTPLTEKEWQYLINDVLVVIAFIKETAENCKGYHKIPLTKTGYVRNYCREQCFKNRYYRQGIKKLTITKDEYKQLKRAFAGGFTHANWHYSGKVMHNVESYDFTSSYPAAMIAEKFPMSQGQKVEVSSQLEFDKYISTKCCVFDIRFHNIDGWDAPDHILSKSKCFELKGAISDNGRIIYAETAATTITNVDFESFSRFYKWESFEISNFYIYEKEYLPTEFVKSIIKLYKDKTELKGVAGKEVEYLKSKEMINSAYGMCVTDIVRDEDTFIDSWTKTKAEPEDEIAKYNRSKNRFLFYPWGIFVTAYARRNLYSGIWEFQNDYIYSDTDSVKVLNHENHTDYINRYNSIMDEKLKYACEFHGIPFEDTRPKTIKGIEKPLGWWDDEGEYSRFKTLGAKRYIVEENGKVNITVAGLNKKAAVPYLEQLSKEKGKDIFDLFDDELYVPGEHTGKSVHTYIDTEYSSQLEDYLGTTVTIHELSGVNLSPADYSLSIEKEYAKLLNGGMIFYG